MSEAPLEPADGAASVSSAEEIASARVVLRGFDKASRAVRTYGFGSAVTERFIQQLLVSLDAHLSAWVVLAVIVEASEFRLGDAVVWHSEDSVGESLSFRLHGDGIRELRIHDGLTEQDLRDLLEALWSRDASAEDDDAVTRLWAKDLATVSVVTADDIIRAPWTYQPVAHSAGSYFVAAPASFKGVIEREQVQVAAGNTQAAGTVAAAGANLASTNRAGAPVIGFEVTQADRERLAAELAAEEATDPASYVLQALRGIMTCERTPDLLTRALVLMPALFDAFLRQGRWPAVQATLTLLDEGVKNPAFEPTHQAMAVRAFDALSAPARVALIAKGLNDHPDRSPEGLAEVLARLRPSAVGPLCKVLGEVKAREHRWVVREALAELGQKNQEPILQGLAGPGPETVRDLIEVIVSWAQEPAVDVLAMLADHADREVRRDALAAIASLRPKGDGAALLAFATDEDRAVRLQALRLLMSGHYVAAREAWLPHLSPDTVAELPGGDRRALFLAMRATSGNGMVPFLAALLPEPSWTHKQKGEQAALAAVDALALSGTPEARAALDAARLESSSAVQRACAAALEAWVRREQKEGA